jgi:hypothetical protein
MLPVFMIVAGLFGLSPLLLAAEQGPAPAPAPALTAVQPQSLLESSIRMSETRNTVSAKIRQQVDLFGKRLAGDGSYMEDRRNGIPSVRLELQIQVGEKSSVLLQVCDGRYFWTYRKLCDQVPSLSRIDAVRAATALAEADGLSGRDPAKLLPGLGGLPRLLRGLHNNFDFTAAQRGQWGMRQVWQLEGGWKPGPLSKILPKKKGPSESGKPVDITRLPEPQPHCVVLLLGQEDLFPYRIEYCRKEVKKEGEKTTEELRHIVTMEFSEVRFNAALDSGHFIYNPGTGEFSDQTDAFLQGLGVKK